MKIHRKFTISIQNTFIESEHALNSGLTTFTLISILAPPPEINLISAKIGLLLFNLLRFLFNSSRRFSI